MPYHKEPCSRKRAPCGEIGSPNPITAQIRKGCNRENDTTVLFFTKMCLLLGKETTNLPQLPGVGIVWITNETASVLNSLLSDLRKLKETVLKFGERKTADAV